ncbi:hypothetical protein FO519_008486 [Halicephalobus sp. NKZ332]|nr:hypothetical protein FO519_008486 [Halicephalobus sp. NKZ332]
MARQVPSSEFLSVFNSLEDQNTWQCIHAVLKFELDGFNGGTFLELFEFTGNPKSKRFYVALKYHKFEKMVLVGDGSTDEEEFAQEAVRNIFPLVSGKLEAEGLFETILPRDAHKEFQKQVEKLGTHPFMIMNTPGYVYFIDEEKLDSSVSIPPEFEARDLEPHHAEQMMSVLLHAQDGDSDQAAIRIQELPSVGIFEKSTNKLVAFEYTDGMGFIAHQYVYPEYRRQGFGRALEVLICQKIISKLNIVPLKSVAVSRPKVVSITEKSGYWKLIKNSKGEAFERRWGIYSKVEKKKLSVDEFLPKIMARQVPPSEFLSIFNSFEDQITWHSVHAALKFELDGYNGGTSLELFEFMDKSKSKKFYMALKHHKFEKLIVLGHSNTEEEEFNCEAFQKHVNNLGSHPFTTMDASAYVFYIDTEKLDSSVDIPPEFEARTLEPRYAEQMMSVLLHFQEGDSDQAAIRIQELPSAAIFEKSTNKLVAFEYTDGVGFIAHQYVYPEYRRQGLGKALEVLICQKIISELNMIPLKAVAMKRPKAMSMTQKLGYWKLVKNSKGEPAEKKLASDGHELTIFDTGSDEKPASLPFNSTIIHVNLPSPEIVEKVVSHTIWRYDFHSAALAFIQHYNDEQMGRIMQHAADKLTLLLNSDYDLVIVDEIFSVHGLTIASMLKKLKSIPYIIFGTNAVSPESNNADLAMGHSPVVDAHHGTFLPTNPDDFFDPRKFYYRVYNVLETVTEMLSFWFIVPKVLGYNFPKKLTSVPFETSEVMKEAEIHLRESYDRIARIVPQANDYRSIASYCRPFPELEGELKSFVEDENSKGQGF